MPELTTGCMELILQGDDVDRPILQVLGMKRIASSESAPRYRLLMSDGKWINSYVMLASQLNDLITNGDVTEFSVVEVLRYITSMVNKTDQAERRVMIVLDLKVLQKGSEVSKKIGNPVVYAGSNGNSKPTPTASVQKPNLATTRSPFGNQNGNTTVDLNTSAADMSRVFPISSLNPYHNKWTIRARVMLKSARRKWNNARGEGELFSVDLCDESGEIRATCFRDQVAKFFDVLEQDKVYYISKCQIKPANKQYNSLNNAYEMTFTGDTVVMPCLDDDDKIPSIQYNFVNISEISKMEANSQVDIIGVCKDVGELNTFTGRTNNREYKKREVTLVDKSNTNVQLTLWGDDAENFSINGDDAAVIAIKNARVSEFNGGKSLSIGAGSVFKINPDIDVVHQLRGWYENDGVNAVTTSISKGTGLGSSIPSQWLTFHEAKENNLGHQDKPDYYQDKAMIQLVKSSNAIYKACKNEGCNKKVVDQENGLFKCEKCLQESPDVKYRLLLNMQISDWTGAQWVTCFHDQALEMLERPANEIGEMYDRDQEEFAKLLSSLHFRSYIFKLRTKVEQYMDQARNKVSVVAVNPVNHREYNKHLIVSLQKLTGVSKDNVMSD